MRNLMHFHPRAQHPALHGNLNQLFNSPFFRAAEGCECHQNTYGAIDVMMNDEELVITVDLPGVDKKDIHTNVNNNHLTITAKRESTEKQENDRYFLMERESGEFERTVRLPNTVDSSKAKAKFNNGVLTISLPKSEAALKTEIEIK